MNDRLVAALAAEEAAIYAYGLLGVELGGADRGLARTAEAAHRVRRDALVTRLAELNAEPANAPAGYTLPFPVTNRATALKLAVHVEDGVARAWRAALPETAGPDRVTALAGLTAAAVQATRWRRTAGAAPLTLAFPGRST